MSSTVTDQLTFNSELRRKLIHLACAGLPLLYQLFLTREQIVAICGIITLGFIAGELLRRSWRTGTLLFEQIFGSLLREQEKNKLTGATCLFISATVTFLIFEKSIAVPAIFTLTISDSLAAITGRAFGRHRIYGKSLEGSLTFFLLTAGILYLNFGGLTTYLVLVCALLTGIELLPFRFSDNLVIGPAAAILLLVGQKV